MYIYPDNLKAKATMWLWKLKDLAIIGIIVLLSVFAFAYAGLWFPLVIAGAYAFLTIQVEDTSIMDFIRYACAYFLMDQQHYEWRYTPDAFLFNAGNIDAKFYIDTLQLEKSEYNLIRYPQRGVCLYKCGNERYNLMVHAPEYKEKLFGSAGGR